MKRISLILMPLLVLLGLISPLSAQNRWAFELRGGPSFAMQKLGDAELSTGGSIEGTISYRFMPHVSAYAGWGWTQFGADQSFAGSNVDFEETGYTFGMEFIHPFAAESRVSYLLRAGGVLNHIEVENSDGEIISDSSHGLGWQAEGGVLFTIGEKWAVLPTVRFRSLAREIAIDTNGTPVELTYLSFGLGIRRTF